MIFEVKLGIKKNTKIFYCRDRVGGGYSRENRNTGRVKVGKVIVVKVDLKVSRAVG